MPTYHVVGAAVKGLSDCPTGSSARGSCHLLGKGPQQRGQWTERTHESTYQTTKEPKEEQGKQPPVPPRCPLSWENCSHPHLCLSVPSRTVLALISLSPQRGTGSIVGDILPLSSFSST